MEKYRMAAVMAITAIADRIGEVLEQPIQAAAGLVVTVSASIGLITTKYATADAEAILRDADIALYQAKAESDQRRRAAWAAFGAAMQRMGQQQQRQNWSATCMAMGPTMTTCTGN